MQSCTPRLLQASAGLSEDVEPSARLTYHSEVFGAALHAPVEAGQQHVLDVVARPVVEFAHVEGAGLVVDKVGSLLQDLHDIFLHHVRVPDLIPGHKRLLAYFAADSWDIKEANLISK